MYYGGKLNKGALFSNLHNAKNPRQPYKAPFVGWSNRGKSCSIFNQIVGMNRQNTIDGLRVFDN